MTRKRKSAPADEAPKVASKPSSRVSAMKTKVKKPEMPQERKPAKVKRAGAPGFTEAKAAMAVSKQPEREFQELKRLAQLLMDTAPAPAAFDSHAQWMAKRQYMAKDDLFSEAQPIKGLFVRIAAGVAMAEPEAEREKWAREFFWLMAEKKFCPGGRVLAGIGTEHGNALNCFVQAATVAPPPSFDGVMEVALKLALVTKVGGGNGVNLDPYLQGSKQQTADRGIVGVAYMEANHPDAADFVQGLMRPPTKPDSPKEEVALRNWRRVIYGNPSNEVRQLARINGVICTPQLPAGVITVPDDMSGIISAGRQVALEAGAGRIPRIDISAMRQEGAPIKGSGGTSSGPYSFLVEIFDNMLQWANMGGEHAGPVATLRYVYAPVLRVVRQGGSRRGAGMATISTEHPSVLDFLTAKDLDREASEGDISTFNISLLVSDAFKALVDAGGSISIPGLILPAGKYHLPGEEPLDPASIEAPYRRGKLPAAWLWDEIAKHAWATGEPGLIFVDRINEASAVAKLGGKYVIRSTNPCLAEGTMVYIRDTQTGELDVAPIEQLAASGPVQVWSEAGDGTRGGWVETQFRVTGEYINVWTLEFEGDQPPVFATAEHTWVLEGGERIAMKDLQPGMKLRRAIDSRTIEHALERHGATKSMERHLRYAKENVTGDFEVARVYNTDRMDARVFCATVPGHHTFTLASGLLSGNCGEIGLTAGEPCDLGAINLSAYVKDHSFDEGSFRKDVATCIRFLDDVLDVNVFALEDNRIASRDLRRLGLGVMGLADMLIKLGLAYDSPEGRAEVKRIITIMREEAVKASEELGAERGIFPVQARNEDALGIAPRRNVAVLTCAPTGTTSTVFGASSGIEPVFSPFMWRKIGSEYVSLIAPLLLEMLSEHQPPTELAGPDGSWDEEALKAYLEGGHGSLEGLEAIPESIRKVFRCAHDISVEGHVGMQGAVQQAFDEGGQKASNAISKTINANNAATVEDIKQAYHLAFVERCKGITVYRDGSRQYQVISTTKGSQAVSDVEKAEIAELKALKEALGDGDEHLVSLRSDGSIKHERFDAGMLAPIAPIPTSFKRPPVLQMISYQVPTYNMARKSKNKYLVNVGHDQGRILEVQLVGGRAGDESNANAEAIGRVISIALQQGIPTGPLIHTLRHINGGLSGSMEGRMITSTADMIAVALEDVSDRLERERQSHYEEIAATDELPITGTRLEAHEEAKLTAGTRFDASKLDERTRARIIPGVECEECKEIATIREQGCRKCLACGHSKCG